MFKRVKKIFSEFKDFAIKGDAFTLAVGIVIGGAFKGIIDSLVNDIIMPPIGFITTRIDFTELFIALGKTQYDTLKEATDAGALVITYGNFINQLIIFLITSFALFIFIYKFQQMITNLEKKKEVIKKKARKCPYCYMEIHNKATKCPYCISDVKGE